MEDNEIYQRKIKNNRYEIQDDNDIEEYNENLSFANEKYNFKNKTYIPSYNNNYNKNYYNNFIPFTPKKEINQNFNNYNKEFRTINNSKNNIKIKNIRFSQDIPPKYLSEKKNNIHHNYSILYNGYTTEDGDSYINYNRDSNFYNQNPYQEMPVIYPEDNNIYTNDNNDYNDYNDEQLIIYPNNKNLKKKVKYFDPETKEGMLKTKNCEIYAINNIEYYPSDIKHKYKPISLGDYILKQPNKNKLKKTKSCTDIYTNNNNDYEIKVFNNVNNDKKNQRKTLSCDHIYIGKKSNDKNDTKKKNIKKNGDNKNKRKKKNIKSFRTF